MRFRTKGELSLRFIGPFEILRQIRETAYGLVFLLVLSAMHSIFHVSMLHKYVSVESYVILLNSLWT